jgi:hypothetical protein
MSDPLDDFDDFDVPPAPSLKELRARLDALESAVTAADLRRLCDLAEAQADALDRATIARLRGVIGRVLP